MTTRGMTYGEYRATVVGACLDFASWRFGQAAFNVLHSVRPEISDAMRGGPLDPFYNKRTEADCAEFFAAVEAAW